MALHLSRAAQWLGYRSTTSDRDSPLSSPLYEDDPAGERWDDSQDPHIQLESYDSASELSVEEQVLHHDGRRMRIRFTDGLLTCLVLGLAWLLYLERMARRFGNERDMDLSLWSRSTPIKVQSDDCRDPYSQHGYIWRGEGDGDITWIPYNLTSSNDTMEAKLDGLRDPPDSALALAPPPLSSWLAAPNRSTDARLNWIKNKTVILFGDSHDRNNVAEFCSQHSTKTSGSRFEVPGGHLKSKCVLPDMNFTLVGWFHYGMAEDEQEWYMGAEARPISVESRLQQLFLPDLKTTTGHPSLLILNSAFWDYRYFGLHADHYGNNKNGEGAHERPLTWSELKWHRMRLTAFVSVMRKNFPGVEIMYRLGQPYSTNRRGGNIATYQMDQSTRAVMHQLKIPILQWASLLTGEEGYADDQHFHPGNPGYMFGSIMLYHLHRVLTTSCKYY